MGLVAAALWSQTRASGEGDGGGAVSSVQRDISLYRGGTLGALRTSRREYQPASELARHQEQIRQSLEQQPARTIAEACQRIKDLTGVERGQLKCGSS